MIVDINPWNFHAELIDASMKSRSSSISTPRRLPECQGTTLLVETLVARLILQSPWPEVDMNDPQLQTPGQLLVCARCPHTSAVPSGRLDEQAILEGPQDEATLAASTSPPSPSRKRSCCSRRVSKP